MSVPGFQIARRQILPSCLCCACHAAVSSHRAEAKLTPTSLHLLYTCVAKCRNSRMTGENTMLPQLHMITPVVTMQADEQRTTCTRLSRNGSAYGASACTAGKGAPLHATRIRGGRRPSTCNHMGKTPPSGSRSSRSPNTSCNCTQAARAYHVQGCTASTLAGSLAGHSLACCMI